MASNPSISHKAARAAYALLRCRPLVYPGTRRIVEPEEARIWHNRVASEMQRLHLRPEQWATFCEVAGVDDNSEGTIPQGTLQ